MDTRIEHDNIINDPIKRLLAFEPAKWMSILHLFVLPLACFYLLELYTNNPWQITGAIQLTNYIFFMALSALFFTIFKRSCK